MSIRYPIIRPSLPPFDEVAADLAEAWRTGQVTVGPLGARLEALACEITGAQHAISVSCCTSGLMLAMAALDLEGEVVLPAYTFNATGLAAMWRGLDLVFADIDPETWNLDPASVAERITQRTSAIIPVYVFGVPPDLAALRSLASAAGVPLLTDAAQALGAVHPLGRAGTLADVEVFSMSPTKVVTAIEGGIVTTDDAVLDRRLRRMRDYGKSEDGSDFLFQGLSARLSELHAAVGCRTMARLDELCGHRRAFIARYQQALGDLPGVSFQRVPEGCVGSGNYMVMAVDPDRAPLDRDALYAALAADGIQSKKYFHPALHHQTVFASLRASHEGKLPVSETVAARTLALPLYGHMAESQVDEIIDAVRLAFASAAQPA